MQGKYESILSAKCGVVGFRLKKIQRYQKGRLCWPALPTYDVGIKNSEDCISQQTN